MNIRLFAEERKLKRVIGCHRQPEDHSSKPDTTCLNCGTVYKGNFCPTCGQNARTKRLTIGLAIENLFGVLASFDRGLLHTVHELMTRPGYMIRDYLEGHRVEYIRPIQLLFLLATVYLLLSFGLGIDMNTSFLDLDLKINHAMATKVIDYIVNSMSNVSFFTIVSCVLMCFPNWLCFKLTAYGKTLSIVEHFYILVYLSCSQLIVWLPMALLSYFTGPIDGLQSIVNFFVMVWVYKEFYHIGVIKSISILILSYLLTLLAVLLIMCLALTFVLLMPDSSVAEAVKSINIQ